MSALHKAQLCKRCRECKRCRLLILQTAKGKCDDSKNCADCWVNAGTVKGVDCIG